MPPRRNFRSRRARTHARPSYFSRIRSAVGTAARYAGYGYAAYKGYHRLKKHVPWLPIRPVEGGFRGPSGAPINRIVPQSVMSLGAGSGHTTYIGSRARSILPARLKTKMIYSETHDVATSPPNPFLQAWNANSLFKPNNTSAGHQPLGFDQIMTMYRGYIVTGCKMILEGSTTSASGAQVNVGALASGIAVPANLSAYNESPYYNTHVVNNQHRWKCSYFIDPAKVLGLTVQQYRDDPDMWGSASASPAILVLAHNAINNIDLSQYVGEHTVTLIFYATFFDPVQLTQS